MTRPGSRGVDPAGLILGVALSGFFDGILLHQVLQWHHLLSLADGGRLDLQVQILADGLFHVAMYMTLAAGLWLLWRRRSRLALPGAGRRLAVSVILGFGLWNVLDVVGFHWVAGLHRIRVDVAQPLAWDVGWLVLLGLAPCAVAAWVARGAGPGAFAGARTAVAIAGLVTTAAVLAAKPARGADLAVVFHPGMSQADAIAAAVRRGAEISAVDQTGRVLILRFPGGADPWRLYLDGALLVGGTAPSGCGAFLFATDGDVT
jgi:uncharacterized membrane protein